MLELLATPENLQQYVMEYHAWAPFVFMLIQISQVVFPVIPGGLTLVAGVLCFGPWWGFVLNYVSICIGSCVNFLLIRKYGKPLLVRLASQKLYDKYADWLDKGSLFDRMFAIAIFMPVAPDDFLCMLAGLTKMTFKKFVLIITLCKPCSILMYSLGLTTVFTETIKCFL